LPIQVVRDMKVLEQGAQVGSSSRMRELQAAWPDGLRDLVASMSAGRSLTQAVSALAAHGPSLLRERIDGRIGQ
jgi:hypothetical protein